MVFGSQNFAPTGDHNKMSTLVNNGKAGRNQKSSIDHAVWGHIRQTHATPRLLGRFGMAILFFVAALNLAFAGSKLSNELQQIKANGEVEVIVQFKHVPTDTDLKPFTAHQLRRRFRHLRAAHMLLSPAAVRALESNPLVTYVTPN